MLKKIFSAATAAAILLTMLFSAVAEEPQAPTFSLTLNTNQIYAGSAVTVDIAVQNNPGITSAKLMFEFDKSALSLIDFKALVGKVNIVVNFEDMIYAVVEPNALTGEEALFRATFKVEGDLDFGNAKSLPYTIGVFPDDATDGDAQDIKIADGETTLNVVPYLWGDANFNGKITLGDAVLALRYAANYVTNTKIINTAAANVDGLPGVEVADAILILRYVAGVYEPQ